MLCAIFGTHYLFIKNVKRFKKKREKKKKTADSNFSVKQLFFRGCRLRSSYMSSALSHRFYVRFYFAHRLFLFTIVIQSLCSAGHNLWCACFWVLPFRMQRTISPKRREKEKNIRIRMNINHINLFREKNIQFAFGQIKVKTESNNHSVSHFMIIILIIHRFVGSFHQNVIGLTGRRACGSNRNRENCTDHKSVASMVARLAQKKNKIK